MRWAALVKQAGAKWWADNALRLAASLSFYTVFSLSPLLIIVIAVAGLVFGESEVQGVLIEQIAGLVGEASAMAIHDMLISARHPSHGLLATVVSVVTVIVVATGVFVEMRDGLNTVWRSPAQEKTTLWRLFKDRLLSFVLILAMGFLLMVSLVFDALLAVIGRYLTHLLPAPEVVLHLLNFLLSFMVLTVLFAMMFRLLPDANVTWEDVWLGAAVTTTLFTTGKTLIGMYLGKAGLASAYGAASSVMVLLLWVYYSSLIFYYGAEFTCIYADRHGSSRAAIGIQTAALCDDDGPTSTACT